MQQCRVWLSISCHFFFESSATRYERTRALSSLILDLGYCPTQMSARMRGARAHACSYMSRRDSDKKADGLYLTMSKTTINFLDIKIKKKI